MKYKAIHKLSSCIYVETVTELLDSILIDIGDVVSVVCLNGDADKVFIEFEKNSEVRSIGIDAFGLIFREVKPDVLVDCPMCMGTGQMTDVDECNHCNGSGKVKREGGVDR
jgi:RecJ-like exonuclease